MKLRYLLALGGLLLGAIDVLTLSILGVSFDFNGSDVSFWVFTFFGSSFAFLGYMLGLGIETRRRERAAVAALEAARERIAHTEKLAVLGQLSAAIAHEVRNPLAIVRSSVQNVAESLPPHDTLALKSCTFAIEEIDRLTRVTSTLLGFARPIHVQRAPTRADDLFERTAQLAERLLAKKQLTLEHAPSNLQAELDADLICQVLLGLIANAVEATPPHGTIFLEAAKTSLSIELAVADSGPGVPADMREKIFDPFVTTRADGTGLGLAVARQIVEAHGGKISVGDRLGGGARFSISLGAAI
jgi:signal transduction histidine kinase